MHSYKVEIDTIEYVTPVLSRPATDLKPVYHQPPSSKSLAIDGQIKLLLYNVCFNKERWKEGGK